MEQQSKQLWNVDIIPFDEILHIQQQLDMICIERLIYCNLITCGNVRIRST